MSSTVSVAQPQHLVALARANEVRLAASRVKRDLAAGRITVEQALHHPDADSLTVLDLLMAQHRWGRARALRTLRAAETPRRAGDGRVIPGAAIPESKRIRTLTPRQREILAAAAGS